MIDTDELKEIIRWIKLNPNDSTPNNSVITLIEDVCKHVINNSEVTYTKEESALILEQHVRLKRLMKVTI